MDRRCCVCKVLKPKTGFYKDKAQPLGYSHRCKECDKSFAKEKYSKYKLSKEWWKARSKYNLRYREKYPEKHKAHNLANYHKDILKKPSCETCESSSKKLHMHHPDYSKPLEVITLCYSCHAKTHAVYS